MGYSKKAAQEVSDFKSKYMPAGINENVRIDKVEVKSTVDQEATRMRRAWGLASSAQAESSAARAPGRHLLHHLEESHRCTTPACSGFSDSVHPPWAPPLTTQVSETSRSYFYPYFTDEEPEAQRNVWNCTWHTVSNICSC